MFFLSQQQKNGDGAAAVAKRCTHCEEQQLNQRNGECGSDWMSKSGALHTTSGVRSSVFKCATIVVAQLHPSYKAPAAVQVLCLRYFVLALVQRLS